MNILELERNLRLVEARIANACERVGRDPQSVTLVAATKTQPVALLKDLYELGHRDFGENKVQEMLAKREALPADISWHFIGHLQSNKAKYVAPFVRVVHGLDRFEQARELARRATQAGRTVRAMVEVNISGEESKYGVDTGDAAMLVDHIYSECPGVSVVGLMGMASYEEDPERTRTQFTALRQIRDRIAERQPGLSGFTELSMGMTNDFEVAIEEGATLVRIGSAIFGERTY